MKAIWVILKHEVVIRLSKPSFWIMALLMPVVLLVLQVAAQLAANPPARAQQPQPSNLETIAIVDEAGILPPVQQGLAAYGSTAAADAALRQGEIDQYVVLPADYAQTRTLVLIQRNYNPLGATPEQEIYTRIVSHLADDPVLAARLAQPVASVTTQRVAGPDTQAGRATAQNITFTVLLLFFFLFTTSGSWMLQSISREKANRAIEVLLVSVDPQAVLTGKIIGVGMVTLVQMVIWAAAGMLLLHRPLAGFQLPDGLVLLAFAYVILGYFLFASLMGMAGAVAPGFREAGQFTFFIILPLMIPLIINPVLSAAPDSALVVGLSLFPFTAPTAMLARFCITTVPAWQVLLSLVLLAGSAVLAVRITARAFRADTLLVLSSRPL